MLDDRNDPLCCCEYFDIQNERNHILGCYCNCVDFDQAADRLCRCSPIPRNIKVNMLLTFQDRLRIPWRGGAKQVTLDTILPIVLLPAMLYIAAINIYCSIIILLTMPFFLSYTYFYLGRILPRTKFFFLWAIWSIIFLTILFESTVPMLELLPEENIAFILLVSLTLFFFYKAKQKAQPFLAIVQQQPQQHNVENQNDDQTSLLISDENDDCDDNNDYQRNVCQICRKCSPPRTFHCPKCQACILKRDHHSVWLDCCIGETNHKYFLLGCIFGFKTLLFGANLSLTSICHPFLIANIFGIHILLPDDCSDVYDQYDVSVCFVGSIYALMIASCIFLVLIHQIFLISIGITGTEWHRKESNNRNSCFQNWKIFICGHK